MAKTEIEVPWVIHAQFGADEKRRILKLKAKKYPTGRITDKAFVEELALAGLAAEESKGGNEKK